MKKKTIKLLFNCTVYTGTLPNKQKLLKNITNYGVCVDKGNYHHFRTENISLISLVFFYLACRPHTIFIHSVLLIISFVNLQIYKH